MSSTQNWMCAMWMALTCVAGCNGDDDGGATTGKVPDGDSSFCAVYRDHCPDAEYSDCVADCPDGVFGEEDDCRFFWCATSLGLCDDENDIAVENCMADHGWSYRCADLNCDYCQVPSMKSACEKALASGDEKACIRVYHEGEC